MPQGYLSDEHMAIIRASLEQERDQFAALFMTRSSARVAGVLSQLDEFEPDPPARVHEVTADEVDDFLKRTHSRRTTPAGVIS